MKEDSKRLIEEALKLKRTDSDGPVEGILYLLKPDVVCPACGRGNNVTLTATGPNERPKPGEVSVCGYCFTVNVYTEDLRLRHPLPSETTAMLADPEFVAALKHATNMAREVQRLSDARKAKKEGGGS